MKYEMKSKKNTFTCILKALEIMGKGLDTIPSKEKHFESAQCFLSKKVEKQLKLFCFCNKL